MSVVILAVSAGLLLQADGLQPPPEMDIAPETEFIIETDQSVQERRAAREHPFDRSRNIDGIIDTDGTVRAPWERVRGCVAERCADVVRHRATGEIAQFEDEWQGGFIATGRGQEVIRIRAGFDPETGERVLRERSQERSSDDDANSRQGGD